MSAGIFTSCPSLRKLGVNPVWRLTVDLIHIPKTGKKVQQQLVVSLHFSVGTWTIWCGPSLDDFQQGTEGLKEIIFKVPALISVNHHWHSKPHNILLEESLCHRLCILSYQWYDLQPVCELVNDHQDIPLTRGTLVHMDPIPWMCNRTSTDIPYHRNLLLVAPVSYLDPDDQLSVHCETDRWVPCVATWEPPSRNTAQLRSPTSNTRHHFSSAADLWMSSSAELPGSEAVVQLDWDSVKSPAIWSLEKGPHPSTASHATPLWNTAPWNLIQTGPHCWRPLVAPHWEVEYHLLTPNPNQLQGRILCRWWNFFQSQRNQVMKHLTRDPHPTDGIPFCLILLAWTLQLKNPHPKGWILLAAHDVSPTEVHRPHLARISSTGRASPYRQYTLHREDYSSPVQQCSSRTLPSLVFWTTRLCCNASCHCKVRWYT